MHPVSTLQLPSTIDCVRQLAARIMTGQWQVNTPQTDCPAVCSWSLYTGTAAKAAVLNSITS